jgi:hypothetical protein
MNPDNAGLLPCREFFARRIMFERWAKLVGLDVSEERQGYVRRKTHYAHLGYQAALATHTPSQDAMRLALTALKHNQERYGVNWRQEKAIAALESALGGK